MVTDSDASASARAYRSIRDGVLDGTYPPGTMLGEASLAADLGVSRTPVRAALARLQDEGWIAVYPKRGALVQGLGERAMADLADARLVLEATSVGRAAPDLRRRLADALDRSIDAQREAFVAKDLHAFIELTIAFHRGFVEASGNRVLLELDDRLSDRQRFVLFAAGERLLSRCADIIAEHQVLTAQLRDGDVARFASTLRAHISETYATPIPESPLEGIMSLPARADAIDARRRGQE